MAGENHTGRDFGPLHFGWQAPVNPQSGPHLGLRRQSQDLAMPRYRSVIIGLTGIGAARPTNPLSLPFYGAKARSHAAAYQQHPQTDLTGVCDLRQEALDEFRANWADTWPDMHYYQNYQEMLEREQPDIVSVVTPDHLHADITVDAIQGSAQAVLCEKPIATTLAEADRMIEAAEAHGVLLSIEHTRRWDPRFHAVREMIRAGTVGPLRNVISNLYGPRAMLFRNGTHMIDMICFFTEADPAWVFALLEPGFAHFREYQGDGGHDPDTDPAANAYMHFANGVEAYFNCVKSNFTGSQFELVCDDVRIEISDRQTTLIRSTGHLEWSRMEMVPAQEFGLTHQSGAVAELVHVLEQGGDLVSPGHEARKTLEIMLAILQSHTQGNIRVNLPLS